MNIGEKIRIARENADMTMEELGKICGTTKQTIYKYENGIVTNIPLNRIEQIANSTGVSAAYLLGWDEPLPDNIIPMPKLRRIPLLGTIACGTPIDAQENYDGDVDLPDNIHADFALRCKGDSMINARIYDGDLCYIRKQPVVENGQIAAVLIDGEATLKRVRLFEDHVILEPENPIYRPMAFWGEEMASVTILGLAVAFTSTIR